MWLSEKMRRLNLPATDPDAPNYRRTDGNWDSERWHMDLIDAYTDELRLTRFKLIEVTNERDELVRRLSD